MITINATVTASNVTLKPKVTASGASINADVGAEYTIIPAQSYEGDYIFTPSDEEQVVPTANLRLANDITINPIPNNYGRISYNGSVLTVS